MSEHPEPEIETTEAELPPIEFSSPGRFPVVNPQALQSDQSAPEPAPFVLGRHSAIERFATAELARAHALALLQQAHRRICLYSQDLEPWLYNHSSIAQACSQFLIVHPRNQLRILLGDSRRAVQDGHRLLQLSRQLSSNCSIRKINPERAAGEACFLLVDDCAFMLRPDPLHYAGYAYYNNPARLRQQLQQFEQAWSHALHDPDLRSFLL